MFGSVILDVAMGIIFIYLFLSLIGTAINELISGILRLRSRTLEEGIRALLHDPTGEGVAKDFYSHPLISALGKGNRKPSYIPARTFALALMDIVSPSDPAAGSRTVSSIRSSIGKIPNEGLKKALLADLDETRDDIANAYKNITTSFNEQMARVSGWYKRKSQWIVLLYAIAIAVVLNMDTISITGSLYRNENLRAGLVAAAESIAKQPLPEGTNEMTEQIEAINTELEKLSFPIGLDLDAMKKMEKEQWLLKICGWLITALAISLGAPFWFDILNKFINIRAAGRREDMR